MNKSKVGSTLMRASRSRCLQVLNHLPLTRSAHHQQLPALGRLLLHQHQQSLQHDVRVPRADRPIVEQTLQVVDDDAAQGRLVSVVEDLSHLEALGRLGEADHVLGADDLDEGQVGRLCEVGGDGRLARVRRAFEEDADQPAA